MTRWMLSVFLAVAALAAADPLTCHLSQYRSLDGLTATAGNDLLTVTWRGQGRDELRMALGIEGQPPVHFQ